MIDRKAAEQLLYSVAGINALVIGDLMLDEYLWGRTERISPEAPVQIVDVAREDLRLGGAGNVVNNLAALGCRVSICAVTGDDDAAAILRTRLEKLGASTAGIFTDPARKTIRKTRLIASNQQIVRIDRETPHPLPCDVEERVVNYLREAITAHSIVFVSDYLKGMVTPRVMREIVSVATSHGIQVVVDPKGADYSKYTGATVLTPNRKEAEAATGTRITDMASLQAAGRGLLESLQLQALVITRSEEGMSVFLPRGEHVHVPTVAREVFDVTGAGDTVLAVMGAAMAAGMPVADAAALANTAAGIVVAKVGTSTVTPEEIVHAVAAAHDDCSGKIRSRAAVERVSAELRSRGKRIVFTNGCFDLLHVGHVKYLQKARALGDILVLGLNTDASVRRLKGDRRPLIAEDERAHILAALHCIDYVVLFDEDTPLELIRAVRPDILVKGGDYTPDTVVGRDFVESYGGRVELVQFVDGRSTSSIIDRILATYD